MLQREMQAVMLYCLKTVCVRLLYLNVGATFLSIRCKAKHSEIDFLCFVRFKMKFCTGFIYFMQ